MNFLQKKILNAVCFCFLCSIKFLAQTGSPLTFSEIMFYPSETNGEFVEIYNMSATETIDLNGYKIKYYTSSSNIITSFIGGTGLAPGKFAVILQGNYDYENGAYKSLIPEDALVLKTGTNNFGSSGMANTIGRELSLLNSLDEVVDSYTYSADNSPGYSDEKTVLNRNNEAVNWINSIVQHGTPGFKTSAAILPAYNYGSLIINEIMFDPAPDKTEYLEFYNASNDSVQLAGLLLNAGASNKYKLKDSFFMIPPNNYFVLAGDSAIFDNYSWPEKEKTTTIASGFSLSNSGTSLVLKDFYETTLDSLLYLPGWHNKNVVTTQDRSLERLNPALNSNDPSNWSTSVSFEGATPGKINSIFSQNLFHQSGVTINPNPFSPDADGFEDFAIINIDLIDPLSQVRIKVFDRWGRLVRVLAWNRPSSSSTSIVFDGLDDSGKPLRIGIYILLIETVAAGSGNVSVLKAPVVIARKL